MPPKSTTGSGKKMSKAEKERRQREEEEQRRLEEEAALREQQELRERRKREKEEEEQRKMIERKELKKRCEELEELRAILIDIKHKSCDFNDERRRLAKWDRYMLCDGSPDPSISQEINTYINLWRENKSSTQAGIDCVLLNSKLCLRLIDELEFLLVDTPSEELSTQKIDTYHETIKNLQHVLQEKLDRASHEMLVQATQLADPETSNLQRKWSNDDIQLCLWGNLCKNPRIKSHEFAEQGVTFDIPKVLALADCAYRLLFTRYDHYSPHSKSYHARIKQVVTEELTCDQVLPEVEENIIEGDGEGTTEKAEEAPISKDPTMDLMAELNKLDGKKLDDEEEILPEAGPEEIVESPAEDLRSTPLPCEWEDFDGEEDSIDLRAHHVLGSLIHFDLVQMPPQPKEACGWKLHRHLDPPALVPLNYQPDDNKPNIVEQGKEPSHDGSTISLSTTGGHGIHLPGGPPEKKEEKPPITFTLKIPPEIYFADKPQAAYWDEKLCEWRTDGVEVVRFTEEDHELAFKVIRFGVLAFFQDFHINMPFQQWELKPLGSKSCRLTIVAAINEVALRIEGSQVFVETNEEKPILNHLSGRPFNVLQLKKALRNAGVNVFPRRDSSKYVAIANKNMIAEQCLYEQMALVSGCMAFAWSRWNTEINDREKLLLQGCEHFDNSSINEEDWKLFSVTRKKVIQMHMKEFDEEFNESVAANVEFHADMYHMYMAIASEVGLNRVKEADFHYINTVEELLKSTRLLTYS